jgi:hypothetical protein
MARNMKYRVAILLAALALFLPASAFAACASPTGNAGDMIYNSAYHIYQYCNGTNWIAVGKQGAGGGGCTSPTGSEADLIYNSASHVYQFCDGATWEAMGPTGIGTPTSGLVGWWKLDDGSGTSAADSSGTGNTGTLQNGPTWTTSGEIGGALTFASASTQYVSVTDAASLRPANWTVSTWVNLTSLPSSGGQTKLVAKDDSNSYSDYGLSIDNGDHCAGLNWRLYFNHSDGTTYAICYAATINTGTWYLATGTWDGTTLTIYVNGVSVATSTPGSTPSTGAGGDLEMGHEYNISGSIYLNGTLDDVRVYNRALAAAEVSTLNNTCYEGDIMYNSASNVMQYCNGTWVGMGY